MIQVGNKKVRGIYVNKEIIRTVKTSDKTFVQPASASITDSTLLAEYFNASGVSFNGSRVRIYEGGVMKSKNPVTYLYVGLDGRNKDQWYNYMYVYEINIKPADPNLAYGYRIRIENSYTGSSYQSKHVVYDFSTGQTHERSGEPVEVNYKYEGTGRVYFNYDPNTKTYTLQVATTDGGIDLTLSKTTDYFIPMYVEIKGVTEIADDIYSDVRFNCLKGYRVD